MASADRGSRLGRSVAWSAALAFAVAVATHAPALRNGFVDWDDNAYVTENPILALGLSAAAVRRAFEPYEANRIPLTWLSLAIDHALFGTEPAGYHATNVLWHAATTALLLITLARATGMLAPAAFVALCFALHPLRVESVAWVSERKDVLSGFWFVAALAAWLAYGRRPSALRHLAALAAGAMSLLAKPTAVTLPLVLLLLDFWPLGRLGGRAAWRRALLEKIPFFALSAAAAVATWQAQRGGGAFDALERLPLAVRAGNAVVSYLWYVEKAFWPTGLTVFYPHPRVFPSGVGLGLVLLGAVTLAALALARRRPWLGVGWLWFLGMLVPMIGVVQVGQQAHADRYAYLSQLGLEVALAFELWAWLRGGTVGRALYACTTLAVALGLGAATRAQIAHWRDTETLFTRALAVTESNFVAMERVGQARLAAGDPDGALRHFSESLRLQPRWPRARSGLARALWQQGHRDAALWNHRAAVQLDPGDGRLRMHLAQAEIEMGWLDEAIQDLRFGARVARAPYGPRLRARLASVLAARGELARAREEVESAVAADASLADAQWLLGRLRLIDGDAPGGERALRAALAVGLDDPELRSQLGDALRQQRRDAEAAAEYRIALRQRPELVGTANNLAWILATSPDAALRSSAEALQLAEATALATERRDVLTLDTLAVAQAANGRFEDAVATIDEAIAIAPADLVSTLATHRARFEAREIYVDAEPAP